MEDLNILRDKAYQNAVAHGWHDKEYSNEHWLCLVMSELMEAVEADRKNRYAKRNFFIYSIDYALRELHLTEKDLNNYFRNTFNDNIKDTVEDELADACIRLFDYAAVREIDLDEFVYEDGKVLRFYEKSFTESIYRICSYVAEIMNEDEPYIFLNEIFSFCREREIDIMWHIEQKMKYNELRPYMHGNKAYMDLKN